MGFRTSNVTDYVIRMMVYLGSLPDEPILADMLAREARCPPAYAKKILASLTRAGLLRGRKGVRGGYRLARQPSEITILNIMAATGDGKTNLFDSIENEVLGRVDQEIREVLSRTTLEDLLESKHRALPAMGIQ